MIDFPRNVDEVTPEWLTGVLRESGAISDARVVGFDAANIGEDQGLVGEVHRLALSYEGDEDGTPASVIAKFSLRDEAARAFADSVNLYEREVRFYREIAPLGSSIAAPPIYFAAYEPGTGYSNLLIADLGSLRAVDQADDCGREDASAALHTLAGQHAAWWDSDRLPEISWLGNPADPERIQAASESFGESLELCLAKVGEFLPAGFEELAIKYGSSVAENMTMLGRKPHTLVHGDFRLGNLFFDDAPGAESPVVAFDWQLVGRSSAAGDVAYFLGGSLRTQNRRQIEAGLLADYYDRLIDLGVKDYSRGEFDRDLRVMVLRRLQITVTALGRMADVALATKNGRRRIEAMCERNQILLDWNCDEVLN